MTIQVRRALATDAEALCRLNHAFNGVTDRTPEQVTRSLRENAQEMVWLALADGKAAGFLCAQLLRSFCYDQAHGLFTELYVAEEFRRRGVASALMEAGERALMKAGAGSISLETGAGNHRAQSFYEAQAYLREDDWVYTKNLLRG